MVPANGSRRWAPWPVWICAASLAAFVVIGAPTVLRSVREGYLLPATEFSSTDAYLTKIEANRAFTGMLIGVFHSFPRDRPVLVLYREGDFEGTLIAQLMAYVAWPHDVSLLAVAPHRLPPELQRERLSASNAALVACHVSLPPGSPPGVSLSPTVTIALPRDSP